MTAKPQSCGSCKWLRVPANSLGRRVVRRGFDYPCVAPRPELPPMPESIIVHHTRILMTRNEGTTCPTYEPIKPSKETKA